MIIILVFIRMTFVLGVLYFEGHLQFVYVGIGLQFSITCLSCKLGFDGDLILSRNGVLVQCNVQGSRAHYYVPALVYLGKRKIRKY